MRTSMTKVAVASAAGAAALGLGLGVASAATASPTPSPASPTASASVQPKGGPAARQGAENDGLAEQLATKLGLDKTKVASAIKEVREAQRPASGPKPTTPPDRTAEQSAFAKALAAKLGVDESKVTQALADIEAAHKAEERTAFKTRLDAAVTAGKISQADEDSILKAFDAGVLGGAGGPSGHKPR